LYGKKIIFICANAVSLVHGKIKLAHEYIIKINKNMTNKEIFLYLPNFLIESYSVVEMPSFKRMPS